MYNIKEFTKGHFPHIMRYLHLLKMRYYVVIGHISKRKLIKIWYYDLYHEKINLENPLNLDEKINWMKLHCDMTLWTKCADKFAVRDFVHEKGLSFVLNEIFGVYEKAEEIDFDRLPPKYVIKSTNGGGGKNVMIVNGPLGITKKKQFSILNGWLKEHCYDLFVEPHYHDIHPRLLVEKYIEPNLGEVSLVDIKINCINGKAFSVFLCSDRIPGEQVCYSVYDLNWELHPEYILPKYRTQKTYPRPISFDKMITYSEKLAEGIPFVRIDWYEVGGQPVFSEMTFTPGGGFQCFYSKDYLETMGKKLLLPIADY